MRRYMAVIMSLAALGAAGWAVAAQGPAGAPAAPAAAPAAGAPGAGRAGAAVPAGPRAAAPTVFPMPGTYANTTGLSLSTTEPDAQIRYTWDGSAPNANSPLYNPATPIFIAGLYEGDRGVRTGYTLRAITIKPGMTNSEVATFAYQVERRDRTAYVSEIVAPGVRMIRDSDNDKMFLVQGSRAYALIDTGQGRGPLREYLSQFTGGLPIIPIFTHSHGDHVGQADQFADGPMYAGTLDRAAIARTITGRGVPAERVEANLKALEDGGTVDIGDRALVTYAVPGHTPGSIAIFDPKTGNLFTGDTFGNNAVLPPDAMWMQGVTRPLDEYFANVRTVRAKLGDKVKLIMTGHNDKPLIGDQYLKNVEIALQNLMDRGDAALVPSFRPAGIVQTVVGDMKTDPDWFSVNVNRTAYLPAPIDQIASLTGLTVTGATLSAPLNPRTADYTATVPGTAAANVTITAIPTSTRARGVTIDGRPAQPGQPATVRITGAGRTVPVVVTAPDGTTMQTYNIAFKR